MKNYTCIVMWYIQLNHYQNGHTVIYTCASILRSCESEITHSYLYKTSDYYIVWLVHHYCCQFAWCPVSQDKSLPLKWAMSLWGFYPCEGLFLHWQCRFTLTLACMTSSHYFKKKTGHKCDSRLTLKIFLLRKRIFSSKAWIWLVACVKPILGEWSAQKPSMLAYPKGTEQAQLNGHPHQVVASLAVISASYFPSCSLCCLLHLPSPKPHQS